MSDTPHTCPHCTFIGPKKKHESPLLSKEQVEQVRETLGLEEKQQMSDKLPDHTFKEGEWAWSFGGWVLCERSFNRDHNANQDLITVSEAKKLGLTPPPKEKLKGWFAFLDDVAALLYDSKAEAESEIPGAERIVYLEETEPPAEK